MSEAKISEAAHKLAYETGMYYSQNEKCQPGIPFYAFTQGELDRLVEKLAHLQGEAVPVAWQSMATCPRDGSVVLLRWGEDHVSPGWWSAPVSPVQNDDGTWPSDSGGFPWAFFDTDNGRHFVNHAVDTKYGPTHWTPYTRPQPAELAELQGVGITADWVLGYLNTDAPEDSREAIRNAFTEWNSLAATGKQQVGEVPSGMVLIQISDAKALCAYVTHSPRSALAARRVEKLIGECDSRTRDA